MHHKRRRNSLAVNVIRVLLVASAGARWRRQRPGRRAQAWQSDQPCQEVRRRTWCSSGPASPLPVLQDSAASTYAPWRRIRQMHYHLRIFDMSRCRCVGAAPRRCSCHSSCRRFHRSPRPHRNRPNDRPHRTAGRPPLKTSPTETASCPEWSARYTSAGCVLRGGSRTTRCEIRRSAYFR